jgi:hypothetical protein
MDPHGIGKTPGVQGRAPATISRSIWSMRGIN